MARHKNKLIAVLLWFFTGFIGGHRFYLGSPMRGVFFIGLLVLGSQLDEAGRSEDQLVFYLIVLLWLYDLYWILSSLRSEASGELQETQRMSFLKKLFGKKESSGVPDLQDLGLEVEVSWGDDGEELSADDYCHNHCFIFYGLNEEAFLSIENEVQNYDGPDALSLLRSMEGVLMAPLNEQSAGTDKISSIVDSDDDLIAYVEERLDKYLELIAENFDSAIGRECIDLINMEKPYIADAIFAATKTWAKSDKFEHEDFIGAMLVFVKSSKAFDRHDSISEQPNGMNLPVVTRSGFVRSCIYSCEDVINVKYDYPSLASVLDDWLGDTRWGNNPKNVDNYGMPFIVSGAPFGFSYFDQDGQLWSLKEVGKAVTLLREDATSEDQSEWDVYEVSH